MSGLTSYYYYEDRVITPATHQYRVYHADEADKVIAELEDKLKVQTSIAEEGWKEFRTYHTSYAEAVKELYEKNKELRKQKYKRCLTMAKWCDTKADWYYNIGLRNRCKFYMKWRQRWLEIADKFKEVEWYNSLNEDYSFWLELYVKWHNRWLELAERFKEAK